MVRYFLIALLLGGINHATWGQSDPKLTLFSFNPLSYNPAFAGAGGGLSLIAMHSSQFTGFDGAPHTQYFSAHGLWSESNLGLGLDFLNDQFGIQNETAVNGNISYYLRISKNLTFAFGAKVGLNHFRLDYRALNIHDVDEDIIANEGLNQLNPVLGFGGFLFSDRFYLGFSSPNVMLTNLDDPYYASPNLGRSNLYLMSGWRLPVNEYLAFQPDILVRSVRGAPRSALVSLRLDLGGESFWGANWESKSSVGLFGGFRVFEKFKTGYAIDFPTNGLGRYTKGTHTLFLSYHLAKFKQGPALPCFYY